VKARITVYPRREILDPQGKAIRDALARIGYAEVASVRAGKSFDVEVAESDRVKSQARLEQMCEKLLANTVVEEYRVELVEDERP
jgi:phosphoribosylformylglycinamidine synthase